MRSRHLNREGKTTWCAMLRMRGIAMLVRVLMNFVQSVLSQDREHRELRAN